MKVRLIASLAIFVLSTVTVAVAQSAAVEELRSQLGDVQKKEGELQTRAKKLEEDLKPENIERFFALNGSTRPEELREERRRQLESELAGVRTRLDQLAQSRVRLETAIATQEAAAYRQSALPDSYNPAANLSKGTVKKKQTQRRTRRRRTTPTSRRG